MLDLERVGAAALGFKQNDLDRAAILSKTDLGIPILESFAGNGFVGRADHLQPVVRHAIA